MDARDTIGLKGATFWAYHGATQGQRETGQRFVVDVEAETDTTQMAQTDDLKSGANVTFLYQCVKKVVAGEQHATLQRIAQRIADEAFVDKRITEIRVTVKKPFVPLGGIIDYSFVTIVRRNS